MLKGLLRPKELSSWQGSRLPPLTRDLEIELYGAELCSFRRKCAFRYKLDGRDATWQEPGQGGQSFL